MAAIPSYVWEALVILIMILANGFFAGAEIAIIAARRGRLKPLAEAGDRAAQLALDLAENPNRFLPTVQVGITLLGTLAAAFGGARLVDVLSEQIARSSILLLVRHQEALALGIVALTITFFSVVLGELVPKRLALRRAAEVARFVARPMALLGRIGRPFVWLLGVATDFVLRLLGIREIADEPEVSVEDITHLIQSGTALGVFEPAEEKLALEALKLGDRAARDIMRPRIDIDALDVATPPDEILGAMAMSGFSRVLVYEDNLDHIIGFLHIKDVLRWSYLRLPLDMRRLMHPVLLVPETLPADRLLVNFQERHTQVAIVLDEFGGTEGMVTLDDVLEELVGEIREGKQLDARDRIVRRDETSWLVDGGVSIDDLCEHLQIRLTPTNTARGYSTVAGLVLAQLGRIPKIGERVAWEGLVIEVVDLDGKRIDRVLIQQADTGE